MKGWTKLFLVALAVLTLASAAQAGSYYKKNASLFLDGKVHIRFDHLLLGWTRDHKAIDRVRYEITCLKGQAVLQNVEYLDSALNDTASVRWYQSPYDMKADFSAQNFHMDRHHLISIKRTNHVKIAPYCLNSAKVRFHIRASGRNYKVIWSPKTGDIYSTW